jgi:hypothetical protein
VTDRATRDAASQRSIGGLLSSLVADAAGLLSLRLELARAQAMNQLKRVVLGIAMFAAAAILALAALGALTASAIAALNLGMPLWLAALIVGVVLVLVAAALVAFGRSQLRKASTTAPANLVAGVKEDAEAIKKSFNAGYASEPSQQ